MRQYNLYCILLLPIHLTILSQNIIIIWGIWSKYRAVGPYRTLMESADTLIRISMVHSCSGKYFFVQRQNDSFCWPLYLLFYFLQIGLFQLEGVLLTSAEQSENSKCDGIANTKCTTSEDCNILGCEQFICRVTHCILQTEHDHMNIN